MDFDKLKQAAKETLRILSNKAEDEYTDSDGYDDDLFEDEKNASQNSKNEDDIFGNTRRVDLKSVLEQFRGKAAEDEKPEQTPAAAEAIDELTKAVGEIDKRTAEITVAADENNEKLESILLDLRNEITALRETAVQTNDQNGDYLSSIKSKLGATEKKLESVSNSLSGISKLGDSIFDLKNSQMNTKNSLGELETAFYKLKRKMTSSITIISILAAIIAALEIINLLS